MSDQPHPDPSGEASCPGCGLANYSGFCPVCRGDAEAYENELQFAFGPWHPETDRVGVRS